MTIRDVHTCGSCSADKKGGVLAAAGPEIPSSPSADQHKPITIALVGTRGVPARYGGFETCVEEVGRRLADRGHRVVVYCRSTDRPGPGRYLGMELVHLPALRRRSLETLSHTALSTMHLMAHPVDAAIVFNCANAPFLPLLAARGIPCATHVDGLEWQRAKWGNLGQRYYRLAERLSVRSSRALIADAVGIADYYRIALDHLRSRSAFRARHRAGWLSPGGRAI